ncbi:nucleolar protein 11 [Orycteropus afer afer]|uniref:Nucleolar protein 11 n=1 Tax=Orycteropus afer afer TaxID=1230840 RepID=A0A8B7BD59_ORYAF|nr:nucleolar protein 11 [Orycteropus afer afer]
MAALEEEFTLSGVPLGAGADGLLGVEQSDKADQFLVTDSGRTVILYKVLRIWNNEDVNMEKVFKATHGTYFAYVQKFNSRILSKYTLLPGREEKSVIQSFTASVDRKFISLISLSSDGCIYETLIPTHPSDPDQDQVVVRSLLLKAVVSSTARNGAVLSVLNQDHIAVLGTPLSASTECLSIWNIKFQTLQASKELPQGTSSQVSFYSAHAVPHFVNWETSQECGLGPQSSEQSRKSLRARKVEVSLQPAMSASKQLLLTVKNDTEKHIEVELRKFLAIKQTPDFHTLVGDIVTELLGRCKAEPSFYPRNCLVQLIQTHMLSYRIIENGFTLKEANCSDCERELKGKPQGPAEERPPSPVTPKRAALLNAILHSAYSEAFLLPHLKDVPAQHVTLFLQYLYFLYLKCSENAAMTLPGIHPPTLNQIMDWICLLLDANFTVVVMIPEAKRLLISLYKFVKAQISIYSELNKIEVSFRELQKLNQEKNDTGLYSIEVLELV